MDFESINNSTGPERARPRQMTDAQKHADMKIREACQGFEAMMTSIILKEGLKTGIDDEKSKGSEIMVEFASEQMASQMAKTESFGIAKMLYNQVTGGKK